MEIVVIFSAEVEEPFFNVVFMLCSKCMMTYIWFGCKNTAAHISAKWNCVSHRPYFSLGLLLHSTWFVDNEVVQYYAPSLFVFFL